MASENPQHTENVTYNRQEFTGNIFQQAQKQWPKILAALVPALHPSLERLAMNVGHGPCPVHGGQDGFRMYNDAAKGVSGFVSGGGVCNTCGAFTSGFKLLEWLDKHGKVVRYNGYKPRPRKLIDRDGGVKTLETDEEYRRAEMYFLVGQYLRHGATLFPTITNFVNEIEQLDLEEAQKKERIKREYSLKTGQALWTAGIANHMYLTQYLLSRGFIEEEIIYPNYTRVAMQVLFTHDDKVTLTYHPAILNPIMKDVGGVKNKIVSMNRIYLDLYEDGIVDKATVLGKPKRILKWDNYMGGACRLYSIDDSETLVIAEGIETSLAVRILSGLPVWATLTAGMMAAFEVPEQIKTLIVAMDYDVSGTGQKSFEKLKERYKDRPDLKIIGVSPEIYYTPTNGKGIDWDDVYTNPNIREQAFHQWAQYQTLGAELPV